MTCPEIDQTEWLRAHETMTEWDYAASDEPEVYADEH